MDLNIEVHTRHTIVDAEGVFSFTLYLHDIVYFTKSKYYVGLKAYLDFLQSIPAFSKWLVAIYTNEKTFDILASTFPIEKYKIVLCKVKWGYFTNATGQVDDTIMRCMRFHAMELFPNSIVSVRDADTFFPYEMNVLESDFSEELGKWEAYFHEKAIEKGVPILIGTDSAYFNPWHMNMRPSNSKIINTPVSMFAGFSTYLQTRPVDCWELCANYLTSRYFMRDGEISNAHITRRNMQSSRKIDVGKDERVVILSIVKKYVDATFFLKMEYRTNRHMSVDIFQLTYYRRHGLIKSYPEYEMETLVFHEAYIDYMFSLDDYEYRAGLKEWFQLHDAWLDGRINFRGKLYMSNNIANVSDINMANTELLPEQYRELHTSYKSIRKSAEKRKAEEYKKLRLLGGRYTYKRTNFFQERKRLKLRRTLRNRKDGWSRNRH